MILGKRSNINELFANLFREVLPNDRNTLGRSSFDTQTFRAYLGSHQIGIRTCENSKWFRNRRCESSMFSPVSLCTSFGDRLPGCHSDCHQRWRCCFWICLRGAEERLSLCFGSGIHGRSRPEKVGDVSSADVMIPQRTRVVQSEQYVVHKHFQGH